MRLLERLGQNVAQRELEVLAVVLDGCVAEHRDHRSDGVLPHGALVTEAASERVQLGRRCALADAELDASVAEEVERRHTLGHASRMVGRELDDTVAEPDVLRALARCSQEHLGGRGVRVLLEEVVLDLPGVIEAETVCELDLLERLVKELVLAILVPRPRELVLVEDAELHLIASLFPVRFPAEPVMTSP